MSCNWQLYELVLLVALDCDFFVENPKMAPLWGG